MILYMPSWSLHSLFMPCSCWSSWPPAQCADETDDYHEPDRPLDFDKESNFKVCWSRPSDMDREEDAEALALMLKHNSHLTIPCRFKGNLRSIGTIGHASADTQRDRGPGQR